MDLSTAIRLGAEKRPQATGSLFRRLVSQEGRLGSCALGAAYEALSGQTLPDFLDAVDADVHTPEYHAAFTALLEAFPALMTSVVCPLCPPSMPPLLLRQIIGAHLNDAHRLTREQIADWLETL